VAANRVRHTRVHGLGRFGPRRDCAVAGEDCEGYYRAVLNCHYLAAIALSAGGSESPSRRSASTNLRLKCMHLVPRLGLRAGLLIDDASDIKMQPPATAF
jgi:hypothetical protein